MFFIFSELASIDCIHVFFMALYKLYNFCTLIFFFERGIINPFSIGECYYFRGRINSHVLGGFRTLVEKSAPLNTLPLSSETRMGAPEGFTMEGIFFSHTQCRQVGPWGNSPSHRLYSRQCTTSRGLPLAFPGAGGTGRGQHQLCQPALYSPGRAMAARPALASLEVQT
jgi:hypothetical protein